MNEVAWTDDPFTLVWPLVNVVQINPFLDHLTEIERVNAHARLTIALGCSLAYILHGEKKRDLAKLVLFWTVLTVLNQGVAYVQMRDRNFTFEPLPAADELPPTFTQVAPPPPRPRALSSDAPLWQIWQEKYNFTPGDLF